MTTLRYIALLRGINVGGRSVITMADLRKLFESCGLDNISTYIQSGNVLFSTAQADPGKLTRQLETQLASFLGRKIVVFVLRPAELQSAARHNPFDPERCVAEQRCHLVFLSAEPDAEHCRALMALQGKEYRFHIQGRVLYYAYSRQYDGHRRSIDFEKVLGVSGTSRTWQVVNKLIELSEGDKGNG